MCLIAWNWQPDSPTPLLLLSNRDEFYARAASGLYWWPPTPNGQILAGKDLQAGGTWLGVSRSGRLAAITNYRHPGKRRNDAPSRGELVSGFLGSTMDAEAYLKGLEPLAGQYNPFNLLVFDGKQLLGLESQGPRIVHFPPGIGGVSNADFNTPWPKLTRLTRELHEHLQTQQIQDNHLLALLMNTQTVADTDLPQTGVAREIERQLATAFVTGSDYGTRACSIVRIHAAKATFSENRFGPEGPTGHSHFELEFQALNVPSRA